MLDSPRRTLAGVAEWKVLRGVVVTLMYFDGCPTWQLTDERVRQALVRAGRDDVRVQHSQVTTPEQAEAAGFCVPPTVLIDRRDPFADPDAPAGLSCRVFSSEAGLAGAPSVEQLFAVLS